MDGESPGFAEAKQLSVRVSLKEIARRFASPLTEEHAWAVLYQLTQRFLRQRENFERGGSLYRSNQNQNIRVVINLDSVLLSEGGEVDVKTMRKKPIWEGSTSHSGSEHKRILTEIGCLLYSLLDYGIPDDQERSLSLQMSNLIEWLINEHDSSFSEGGSIEGILDDEPAVSHFTADSGITEDDPATLEEGLLYIIKACECHAFDVPSPEAHYKAVCRSLVEEAVSIQGVRDMETGKERDRKKLIEGRWKEVMKQVKAGVQLQKVAGDPESEEQEEEKRTFTRRLSTYDLLLMQISKYDKNKLRKASTIDSFVLRRQSESLPIGPNSNSVFGRRATVGDIHSTLMHEIKFHPTLKPASKRSLRPASLSPRPLSPMESLMEEILTPPALRKVDRTSPKHRSLGNSRYLSQSVSDVSKLRRSGALAPFPSAHHLNRCDWERDISLDNTDSDDCNDQQAGGEADDVFDSLAPSITLSPPKERNSAKYVEADSTSGCTTDAIGDCQPSRDREKLKLSLNPTHDEFEILDFPLKEADASLTLSFDEVVHIRRVISRAELLDLQLKDMTLFWEVWKNKICFLCHKSRFSCFKRSFTCRVCERKLCSKCITKRFQKKERQSSSDKVWYVCQLCWDFTLSFSSPVIYDH